MMDGKFKEFSARIMEVMDEKFKENLADEELTGLKAHPALLENGKLWFDIGFVEGMRYVRDQISRGLKADIADESPEDDERQLEERGY